MDIPRENILKFNLSGYILCKLSKKIRTLRGMRNELKSDQIFSSFFTEFDLIK